MKPRKSVINLLSKLIVQARKTQAHHDLRALNIAWNNAVEVYEEVEINNYFTNDELVLVEDARKTMARLAKMGNR